MIWHPACSTVLCGAPRTVPRLLVEAGVDADKLLAVVDVAVVGSISETNWSNSDEFHLCVFHRIGLAGWLLRQAC